VILKHKI